MTIRTFCTLAAAIFALIALLQLIRRHLEWRRCAVLGELDRRHRGGRVELRRLPRRHAPLKAGRARPGRSVAGQRSHFPTRGHRAVVLYRDSGFVQYMFCDPNILRHDSGGSSEGGLPVWIIRDVSARPRSLRLFPD